VIAVSDASPLIALSRIGCLELLPEIWQRLLVPTEVYEEVVISGADRPGAAEVANARWIESKSVQDRTLLASEIEKSNLGSGEVAVVWLARELNIDVVFIDERRARHYAQQSGLISIGSIGILEVLHRKGLIGDLRYRYQQLLQQEFRIDFEVLQSSLRKLGLDEL
jgi:predicted nucleic acid-binding protein